MKTLMRSLFVVIFLLSTHVWAGDDPSIKGDLRKNIQQAMSSFIDKKTVNGKMYLYDTQSGSLLKLTFDNLHSGIVKKGDFYVSCADFVDQNRRKIDIDFLVIPKGSGVITAQALIHAVNGDKRKYHLESL